PLLEEHTGAFLDRIAQTDLKQATVLEQMMPRVVGRILARAKPDFEPVMSLFRMLHSGKSANPQLARQCLAALAAKIQSGEVAGDQLGTVREQLGPVLKEVLAGPQNAVLFLDAAFLVASLKDVSGLEVARKYFAANQPEATRLKALSALIAGGDSTIL